MLSIERNGVPMDIEIPENSIAPLLKSTTPILPRIPFFVNGFPKNSAAEAAGLKAEDRIIGLDHKAVPYYDDFRALIPGYKNNAVPVTVLRNDKDTLTYTVNVDAEGRIGVYANMDVSRFFELKEINYSFIQAIPAGISKGLRTIDSYLKQLKLLFRPETKAYESIGGFIKIGSIFAKVWDWQSFWSMTALLSIILAVMNILPIPALDGGHVMFLIFEMVTGRKPGDKFLEYAQITGMVIILSLVIYANGNDIIQIFKK
jgi:regulator of sigma E protease